MSLTLLKEQVDIYQYPSLSKAFKSHEHSEITIGDLHGNAIKLLYMLIKHGIATNISKKSYKIIIKIYEKPVQKLIKKDLELFNEIINELQIKKTKIRLIGDELCDRGSNDYFTLKILEKLHKNQVEVEILVSNHGVDFLSAYAQSKDSKHFNQVKLVIGEGFTNSFNNLTYLLNEGFIPYEEIESIIETAYKPTIKVLSYTVIDKNTLAMYSHAAIGLNTLFDLAKQFNVSYDDSTISGLVKTIDAINNHFKNKDILEIYPNLASKKITSQDVISLLKENPFFWILWNREYEGLFRPKVHKNYHLMFIHGHDSSDPDVCEGFVYGLDNELGKVMGGRSGEYSVIYY